MNLEDHNEILVVLLGKTIDLFAAVTSARGRQFVSEDLWPLLELYWNLNSMEIYVRSFNIGNKI